MWPREIVEDYDVDEDFDQTSRKAKEACDDTDSGEDQGDGSSP